MPKPLQVLSEAADEGREAYQWYLQRSHRAAQRFQRKHTGLQMVMSCGQHH